MARPRPISPSRATWITRAGTTCASLRAGDGQSYTVVIMGPQLDTIPAMYSFKAEAAWQDVTVPLNEMANVDLKRVKVISIGSMHPGPFRFEIDRVRIE